MKPKQWIFDYMRKRQAERTIRFPHFEQPLRVLLIYESDMLERNDAIKTIRQDLLRRRMDVTTWGYVEKKEVSSAILPQSRIVGMTDFNLIGKPQQEIIDALRAQHYDLLIDLSTRHVLPLRYLALYADAYFKVGLNLGDDIHDMLISVPDLDTEQARPETTWLYDLIIKYLSAIKSND